MVSRRRAATTFGALVLGLTLAAPMHGSGVNLHTNNVTFSGPVRLPGVTLTAGTYIFERVEATNPDIVVVRSGDRTKVYYMAMTQRAHRPEGLANDRLVTFGEARPGAVPPIAAWYPIGEAMGHAFVYPRR